MSKKLHQILKIQPEDNVTPLYPSFGSASNNFGKIPEDAHVQIVNCNIDPSKPRGHYRLHSETTCSIEHPMKIKT